MTRRTATTEHPIAFSTPMIRAYQAGAKTETRRVVKPSRGAPWRRTTPVYTADRWFIAPHPGGGFVAVDIPGGPVPDWVVRSDSAGFPCPYGKPGDRLRIKEDLRIDSTGMCAVYAADNQLVMVDGKWLPWRWKRPHLPARFMPTIACRYRPPLLDVRVERVQDITDEGAIAEGARWGSGKTLTEGDICLGSHRLAFANQWNRINGKRSPWSRNDWVWVLKFERCSP